MTALWTSDVLASVTGGTATRPFAATGVSIDSRTVQPGDVFVALLGSTDGHAHVADALARGASGAVVHDAGGLDGAPLLVVAEGGALTFVDYQVRQVQRYPIRNTPLGVLLDPKRDLSRYARLVPSADQRLLSVEARDPKHP